MLKLNEQLSLFFSKMCTSSSDYYLPCTAKTIHILDFTAKRQTKEHLKYKFYSNLSKIKV